MKFTLNKFTIIITTRCNLRCKLCCEYVPQNKPFNDITIDECKQILSAFFATVDYVETLHLSGGGEPFLHTDLAGLVKECIKYSDKFSRLMLFTNCTIEPTQDLQSILKQHKDKIIVQVSRYGIHIQHEDEVVAMLKKSGAKLKIEQYYGENQSFGGWVDFGNWEPCNRSKYELASIFKSCSVTSTLKGNWRTRDGKVHWCSRSQRGRELGLLPDNSADYVDLLDSSTTEEKREKFTKIASCDNLLACDYCSGDAGTNDTAKRYRAAEQINYKMGEKNGNI